MTIYIHLNNDDIPLLWELDHLNALFATWDEQDEFYSVQDSDTYFFQ